MASGGKFQDRCPKPFRYLSNERANAGGCVHRFGRVDRRHDATLPARSTRRAMLQRCTSEGPS